MTSASRVEHFVTLFDSGFLPMGMTLHDSLLVHGEPFHLWIICMDELVARQLELIALPHVTLIPLPTMETPELLQVKPGRARGEYCWTLTPFTFQAVFDRNPQLERVTYLDADLFFFSPPALLLRELDDSGKDVLITEHAYAPQYRKWLPLSGRFCVQFMTFKRNAAAQAVMKWWQDRCIEWCFGRVEEGKFGDQMYLNRWPELFAEAVHIVRQTEKTLAPWNVKYLEKRLQGRLDPVFYHFQGFRLVGADRIKLYGDYKIGKDGLRLYRSYLQALSRCLALARSHGIEPVYREELWSLPGRILNKLQNGHRYAAMPR